MGFDSYLIALVQWLVSAFALRVTAFLVPGFRLHDFPTALIAAFLIGLGNLVIRPFLLFITLPLNILTLGLFTFVVNAIILRLCAAALKGFEITGWLSAVFGAFVLACVSVLLHAILV